MNQQETTANGINKNWGWSTLLPLILVIAMLSGLCGHSHTNIMGKELCHHSHMHSPTEVIRDTLSRIGVGQQLRHIGNHCD